MQKQLFLENQFFSIWSGPKLKQFFLDMIQP